MADISLCFGESVCKKKVCPVRETCVRFLTPRNRLWQSMVLINSDDIKETGCDEYYANTSQRTNQNTSDE
jgi:hypothetical protein